MKLPHECQNIEEVRQEIDEIDQAIIGLIGKRFAFIQEIVMMYMRKTGSRLLSIIEENWQPFRILILTLLRIFTG
jgi:chorismate mutase